MQHEVFNGWIELRNPDLVPERLRRPVFEKSAEGARFVSDDKEVDTETLRFFGEFNDLLAIALVEKWSFSEPVSLDGLLNLPAKTYDDIRAIVSPFITDLIPNFGVDPDPKATTES